MHLRHLSVVDFRSYAAAELPLQPGVTTLIGLNGQGKTNLVEAAGYLSTLSSHRVATDAPLVRHGAQRAVVRAVVARGSRETLLELEITPGRSNRARVNRAALTRPRDLLGAVRTVLFAPEDLALVKGDPAERRRFLDDLLVARQPRWAATLADYDRVLRQRNALLKSAAPLLRTGRGRGRPRPVHPQEAVDNPREAVDSALHTLGVWDAHLAATGAALLTGRLRLLRDLGPLLAEGYDAISTGPGQAAAGYRSSLREDAAHRLAAGEVPEEAELETELLAALAQVRAQEVERGVSLVGPHRDDVHLSLGALPAKGYASHGESWSIALGLRLAAYQLLRRDLGEDPVLVLDDVFAELDAGRRERLAGLIAGCEQVLVTAAVPEDVPKALGAAGRTYRVAGGEVTRVD